MHNGLYCMQRGVLKILSEEESKSLYQAQCLNAAEECCKEAKIQLDLANILIQESHRYDTR